MTMKSALNGTMGLGAACLLAGSVAWAQSTPTYTTPGAPSAAAPTVEGRSASPDRVGTVDTRPTGTTLSDTATTEDDSPVSVAGRVDKVDRADDTIEIDGIDRQLKLDSSTRVTRNGAQASFSEVEEGEQVRASFDDGFPAHVRQIEIMSPGSAASAGSPSDTGAGTSTGTTGSSPGVSGTSATEPDTAPVGHPLPATPSGTSSGTR